MKRRAAAAAVALLGTASDVGKSVLAAALCRVWARKGRRVAPFKAQNLSNNSMAVAGGEMARAQVLQAQAAGVEPDVRMAPVLLKPQEAGLQVVLRGKVCEERDGAVLAECAMACLSELREEFDVLVIEGSGSCAEVNLRERDFANFKAAEVADAAVVLVADIERGGVFAQVVGTLELLEPQERKRVCGIIVNRFRGDPRHFEQGREFLERRCGLPVLGVVPWLEGVQLDSEDALPEDVKVDPPVLDGHAAVLVAVIRLPSLSNFTDVEPLRSHAGVDVHYLATPRALDSYDMVVLPGSKSVLFDLAWLRRLGWEAPLLRYEGMLVGICGGFQLLGREVCDELGVEGEPRTMRGLGLLPHTTELRPGKVVTQSQGRSARFGCAVRGYEIHCGVSSGGEDLQLVPFARLGSGQLDGCCSEDGRVWGTYLHGLFDAAEFRGRLLRELCPELEVNGVDWADQRKDNVDRMADHVERYVDVQALEALVGM